MVRFKIQEGMFIFRLLNPGCLIRAMSSRLEEKTNIPELIDVPLFS